MTLLLPEETPPYSAGFPCCGLPQEEEADHIRAEEAQGCLSGVHGSQSWGPTDPLRGDRGPGIQNLEAHNLGAQNRVDSKKLEHQPGMIYAGCPSSL